MSFILKETRPIVLQVYYFNVMIVYLTCITLKIDLVTREVDSVNLPFCTYNNETSSLALGKVQKKLTQ